MTTTELPPEFFINTVAGVEFEAKVKPDSIWLLYRNSEPLPTYAFYDKTLCMQAAANLSLSSYVKITEMKMEDIMPPGI